MNIKQRVAEILTPIFYSSDKSLSEAPAYVSAPYSPEEEGICEDPYLYYLTKPLVRVCVNLIADLVSSEGMRFESKDESTKEKLEDLYDKLHIRRMLRIAVIQRIVSGTAAFEVVGGQSDPSRLVPLRGEIEIEWLPNWEPENFKYTDADTSNEIDFPPDKILYMPMDVIGADMKGHSKILPLIPSIKELDTLTSNFEKVAKSMWSPPLIFVMETKGRFSNKAEKEAFMTDFLDSLEPGGFTALDENFHIEAPKVTPEMDKLQRSADKAAETIVRGLNVPKEIVNLGVATGRKDIANLIAILDEMTVRPEQTELGEYLDEQLFRPYMSENAEYSIKWNPISSREWITFVDALTKLAEAGIIKDDEKLLELIGWDKTLAQGAIGIPTEELPEDDVIPEEEPKENEVLPEEEIIEEPEIIKEPEKEIK